MTFDVNRYPRCERCGIVLLLKEEVFEYQNGDKRLIVCEKCCADLDKELKTIGRKLRWCHCGCWHEVKL